MDASNVLRRRSPSAEMRAPSACSANSARSSASPVCPGEGLQQMPLLGQRHAAAVLGQHGEDAQLPAAIPERHVQRRRRGQRVGAQAGLAPVVRYPLRHRQIRAPQRGLRRRIARKAQVGPLASGSRMTA